MSNNNIDIRVPFGSTAGYSKDILPYLLMTCKIWGFHEGVKSSTSMSTTPMEERNTLDLACDIFYVSTENPEVLGILPVGAYSYVKQAMKDRQFSVKNDEARLLMNEWYSWLINTCRVSSLQLAHIKTAPAFTVSELRDILYSMKEFLDDKARKDAATIPFTSGTVEAWSVTAIMNFTVFGGRLINMRSDKGVVTYRYSFQCHIVKLENMNIHNVCVTLTSPIPDPEAVKHIEGTVTEIISHNNFSQTVSLDENEPIFLKMT